MYKGGIQTHVWELSKWMMRKGYEVSILSAGSVKKGSITREVDGRTIHEIRYFPGRYIPIFSLFTEEFFFNLAVLKWLKKNHENYDIIHLQGRSGYLYPKRRKRTDTPCVATFHGTSYGEYLAAKGSKIQLQKDLHQKYTTPFEVEILKCSDHVIAVSEEMKGRMLREYGELSQRAQIIYNGIDSEGYEANETEKDPNLLLFVGRLAAVKGVYPLLDAMVNVNSKIHLAFIGSGPDQPALLKKSKELKLTNRVSFLGTKSTDQVIHWLYKSNALILPSYHESQGIVLMEANVCERPVIASKIPGIDEVVVADKNGLFFEAGNIEQISNTINKLFDSPEKGVEMGKYGKEYILKKFSWDRIAEETDKVYQQLVSSQA